MDPLIKYLGLDTEWHVARLESIENAILVTCYKCPLITKGKRKGNPNWSKKTDKRVFSLTKEQYRTIYPS